MDESKPVLIYDGECGLCHGLVRWVLRRDGGERFLLAAVQSPAGSALARRCGIDPARADSMILWSEGRGHLRSDAVFEVLRILGGGWKALRIFRHLPRGLRDGFYNLVARSRQRFFKSPDACTPPLPGIGRRYLPDGLPPP